ncbi:MAG: PAS domain-containing sensor histidine kinase [Bacteroidota bacterium]
MKKKIPQIPVQLEQLLQILPDAAYILDGAGIILYANPAVHRHTGWESAQLVGQCVADSLLFALPFRSSLMGSLLEQGVWEGESERIRPDGSLNTVQALWQGLPDPDGAARFIGIDRDISELRTQELELQQCRKLAKIGILSEGIAHELRNPLSYALSAAQLLNEDTLPEEVRQKCVQTITMGVKKAGLIVENMLSLGRPQTQITRQRVNIVLVLAEAIEAASSHANYSAVRIFQRLPGETLFVSGNHDMLVQVFHNVITNALNEMPNGGSITVSGENSTDSIRISVSDTGPGIPEEHIDKLFDPFYSASSSGTGTGLGLTLSYFIMKEHAGSIEVEAHPGSGATFVLTFPGFNES